VTGLLPSEALAKAADLIEPEGAWRQGPSLRDGAQCAVNALAAATRQGQSWGAMIDFAYQAIGLDAGSMALSEWNDAPGRTQAEVVAALRQAAELARSEGQ
jgi:hypothetical protein